MAEVKFWRDTTEGLKSVPTRDGQLLYNTETGETFLDVDFERIKVGARDYVTPEMFGAKGNGVNDDTNAFTLCARYANLVNSVLLAANKYKVTNLVLDNTQKLNVLGTIVGNVTLKLNGANGTSFKPNIYVNNVEGSLVVMGANSAFITVSAAKRMDLVADSADAENGFIGYNIFKLGRIKEFHVISKGQGWVNENLFIGGRFSKIEVEDNTGKFENNLFLKSMCEKAQIDISIGEANVFQDMRLEGLSNINFYPNAFHNVITTNYSESKKNHFLPGDYDDGVNYVFKDLNGTNKIERNPHLNVYDLFTVSKFYNPNGLPVSGNKLTVEHYTKVYEGEKVIVPKDQFCVLADLPDIQVQFYLSFYDEMGNMITDPKLVKDSPTVAIDSKGRVGNQSFKRKNYWVICDPTKDSRVHSMSITVRNSNTLTEFTSATFRISSERFMPQEFIDNLKNAQIVDIGADVWDG